jgi:C-terminal processing protease CtpA/Prc
MVRDIVIMSIKTPFVSFIAGLTIASSLLGLSAIAAESSARFTIKGGVETNIYSPFQDEPGVVGLDIVIRQNQYPEIRGVFAGSPAHLGGIRPYDRIIAINGNSMYSLSKQDVDLAISDIPGTPVTFRIRRDDTIKEVRLNVAPISQLTQQDQGRYISMGNH